MFHKSGLKYYNLALNAEVMFLKMRKLISSEKKCTIFDLCSVLTEQHLQSIFGDCVYGNRFGVFYFRYASFCRNPSLFINMQLESYS